MTNLAGAILDPLLRDNPAGPRITYYDDATGERIELSAVTLGNWAAKTANLLRDELGAGPGSRIAVLLPAHWQTAGVLFGIWYIGAEVLLKDTAGESIPSGCDIALCTADRIDAAQAAPDDWRAWYWAGVGLLEAGDKKQARAALEHAWAVRDR